MKKSLAICLLFFLPYCLHANIRLPNIIGSNMVLQQQSDVKLWGWANPKENISITTSWDGRTYTAISTRDANWEVSLKTPAAGGPYTITLKGENSIVLENVLIGEVWVCSGQSNMEMNYDWGKLPDIKAELPVCYNKDIRLFYIPRTTAKYPQDKGEGRWVVCDSNTLKSFSAVGYFFGKKLNAVMKFPVGLINANWGGTPAEVWTPADAVNTDTELKESAAKLGHSDSWPYDPGATFNGMIAPIVRHQIAGTIWYQGESNTGAPDTYAKLLTTLIGSWRKAWGKELPFYYAQIAPYRYGNKYISSIVREQQTLAMSYPNVGMVVTTDLVDNISDIHPKNKHDVGYRLANWALSETYHQPGIIYKNPVYKSMMVQKDRAIIQFDNVPTGMKATDKTVTEVYVAGEDRVFYPAEAKVEKDHLVAWSKNVKVPVAVRFGFSNTAMPNLFSNEGLPVNPFRTDNWPLDRGPEEAKK